MLSFVEIIEILGTIAFAISGIRLASAKRFDWFGAIVVGFATACGGGTIRDLLLGVPAFWLASPLYITLTLLSVLWVRLFSRLLVHLNNTFFFFDTLGLALFTIVGMEKSLDMGYPFWVAIGMGCLGGAAGGVIRDVLINEIPLIFHKEIYAIACINGGLVWWGLSYFGLPVGVCELVCGITVFSTRVLAVKYQWCLSILPNHEDIGDEILLTRRKKRKGIKSQSKDLNHPEPDASADASADVVSDISADVVSDISTDVVSDAKKKGDN